jgi:hypothetical protein
MLRERWSDAEDRDVKGMLKCKNWRMSAEGRNGLEVED